MNTCRLKMYCLMKRMGVNETAKGEKTGPEMTWVDNKKANAMIPPLWIIKWLRIFGAAENMLSLLEKVRINGWWN